MITERTPTPPEPSDAPVKMTYEEFLAWADEDTRAEWVNGEVQFMSPTSDDHQAVGLFLILLLGSYARARDAGAIRYESYQMKLGPDMPSRQPDVLFVATEHLARFRGTYLDGPADLVVEIVSPSSVSRDRGEKFDEYERGGVREYWIIEPERRRAEFHALDAGGVYRAGAVDAEGRFHSAVLPGFWLKVDWLWDQPPLSEALSALGV